MKINKPDKKELRNFLESMLVPHTQFTKALIDLEQGFEVAESLSTSYGLFICGESRTGKSRLLEEFRLKHPPYNNLQELVYPILYVQVPSKPTVRGLASEILAAFGDPLADKGTEVELTRRILNYIKQCQTRVLILDEFQHFVDKSTNFKVIHHASDWLKNFLNSAKIVVVIAGLPYGDAVLGQNNQLRGRFTKAINLTRFDWKKSDSRNEFLGLLDGFTELLRMRFQSVDLGDEEIAYRLYHASGGLTGYIFNIIRTAVWHVIDQERTTITIEDLHLGYERFVSEVDRISINPFSTSFSLFESSELDKASKIGMRADDYAPEKALPRYKPRTTREALS